MDWLETRPTLRRPQSKTRAKPGWARILGDLCRSLNPRVLLLSRVTVTLELGAKPVAGGLPVLVPSSIFSVLLTLAPNREFRPLNGAAKRLSPLAW